VKRRTRTAFSLIEVVVVLGILGVLISLLLPAVQSARRSAARVKCANNIKQLALAVQNYESSNGCLPPGRGGVAERLLSWHALILPFLDQDSLWHESVRASTQTSLTYKNPPHVGYTTVVTMFTCPADSRLSSPLVTPSGDRAAFSSYLGVSGALLQPGALGGQFGSTLQGIVDGTSSTLLIGERPPPASLQAGRWYSRRYVLEPFGGPDVVMSALQPLVSAADIECRLASSAYGPGRLENPCDRYHYWSPHGGGANFAFADGSTRFIRYEASQFMPALATRAGGEVATLPD
jgi:prepilin-type processing-associated H-X9-DG protein/prepilin-type N-terminal cleavage/methylation domain-containing protein